MKRFLILLAATGATVGLVAFATPAVAQERGGLEGPRAEVTVGYDTTRISNQPTGIPDSVDQARIGLAIGYDLGIGTKWTVGGEIGAGETLGDGRRYLVGTSQLAIDQGRDLDASLRVGYKAGDRTLLYAKAGWANSKYIARADDLRESSKEDGVRVGGGIEHMLSNRIYAKAEYRYTSYGHDVNRHQLLGGVGIRF